MSENRFDIVRLLEDVVGYKGIPFPGAFFPQAKGAGYDGKSYETNIKQEAKKEKTKANKGAALYEKDLFGNYYFMPVYFIHEDLRLCIDCALISISGRKNIIETPLVGRKGTVKELISLEDYQISIAGAVIGYDLQWPEEKLDDINRLYMINESVELKCALTDVFFEDGDKVVITDIHLPSAAQTEHVQIVEIKCVTDKPFELNL